MIFVILDNFMKEWIIGCILIIGVVLPVEYYIHSVQMESTEIIHKRTTKSNSQTSASITKNASLEQNKNLKTGPWPFVDWKFTGRKLKLKQPPIEKGEGDCEHTMNARIYNWMSDRGLRKKGIKARTPLIVLENKQELIPHTDRSESWNKCDGKSMFHNKFVHFSQSENVLFEDSKYEISLSTEFPLRTKNMVSWWLYKGYQMTTNISTEPKYSGKTANLYIKMRMIDRISEVSPRIQVSDQEMLLQVTDDVFEGSLKYTIPSSDWNISIESKIQGSYFLIENVDLTIENQKFNLLQ